MDGMDKPNVCLTDRLYAFSLFPAGGPSEALRRYQRPKGETSEHVRPRIEHS